MSSLLVWLCRSIIFWMMGCTSSKKEVQSSLLKQEEPIVQVIWEPFSQEVLQKNTDRARIVYVSADWCLTCVQFEQTVLLDPQVQKLLLEKNILAMRADFTRADPQVTEFLKAYRHTILPVFVYMPASGEDVSFERTIVKEHVMGVLDP